MDSDHHDEPIQQWYAEKKSYDLNSKIVLTANISLSIVVLLHIYTRYVLRRQACCRAAICDLGLTVVHMHPREEPPKSGLNPLVIASLPMFVFRQAEAQDEAMSVTSEQCAVCLSALEDGEMARELPNCKHMFHVECIDRWLSSHSTCPICRTEAKP